MENFNKVIRLDVFINKNVISLDRGRVISSIDLNTKPGNYPVYSSSSQNNGLFGAFDEFDFDEELITWSVDGGGYFFYRPKHKFSVTNVSGILRILDKSKLDYKFLYYLLDFQHRNQLYDYVDKAHPSVIKKRYFIPEIEIVEQKKIADIFSKIDKAISETEVIIAKYNRIKTGLMQDLLTKGIDEKGNIRSEETHEFKDSPLGRIPKEWSITKLGELITAIDPQPDHRTPPQVLDGIPYLGISDFTSSGDIDIINCRKVGYNVLNKQSSSFNVDEGDIIFGKIGTIGKPKKLPSFEKSPFTLSANVILIKPFECPAFVYWSLISDYINVQVSLAIHSTSQPAFGMEKIRALNIITPQPKEREVITEKLKAFENIFFEEEKKLSKLKSIKTGLMQDLLSGKKRVTHLTN